MSLAEQDIELVVDGERLRAVCALLKSAPVVALDTEFIRVDTFYPIAALIQLCAGGRCYLIDPTRIESLAPLAELLQDTAVVKVLHSCSEDLEVLARVAGVQLANVFDTQIAAALLGDGFSVSYRALVEHHLGISLDKGETRSDWLKRPLTESQCSYAAQDVRYLLMIYHHQCRRLEELGRTGWMEEECVRMLREAGRPLLPEESFLRIGAASAMDARSLTALRDLCAWRERKSMELDRPRNRVLPEKSLLALASKDLHTRESLVVEAGLSPGQVRRFGDELLRIAQRARREIPDSSLLAPLPSLDRSQVRLLQQLTRRVQDKAQALRIAPEILGRKRMLETWLKSWRDVGKVSENPLLSGWRKSVVGDELLAMIQEAVRA